MKKYIKDNIGEEEWGKFVSGNDMCCVFHSTEWERLLRKEYGFEVKRVCEVDDNNEIVSGGQFCVLKDKLVGLPFSDYYGIVKSYELRVNPPNKMADAQNAELGVKSSELRVKSERRDFTTENTENTEKRQILGKEQKDFTTENTEGIDKNYELGIMNDELKRKDFTTEGTEKRQILGKEQKDFTTENTEGIDKNYELGIMNDELKRKDITTENAKIKNSDGMMGGVLNYLIEGGMYKEVVVKSFVEDDRFVKKQSGVVHFGNLEGGFDEVSMGFAEMHKRGVKKAVKAGLIVMIDRSMEGVKKYYGLHLMTRKRQGVPVQPFSFFMNLFDEVIDKGLGFVGLVYKGDVVVSGGVYLYFNKTFTYKFGASDLHYLDLRPNNLLFYEMIKYAVENGFKVFDFGKTDMENEGLRKFKSGWGAVEKPLYYSYYPEYKPSRLFEFVKDRIVAPIIKVSPKFVCRVIGEVFYKYSV